MSMSILEAYGNAKLLAVTESNNLQLWNEITSNGIAWEKYGSTMGNAFRGGEAAVLAVEYEGGIYPLFDEWTSSSGGFSLPYFKLHGGQGERALEAEVSDGYIYLLQEFPPGAGKPTQVVEKFKIEKVRLKGIDDTLTAGTQSIGWESSSSLLEDYGQGDVWAKFKSDYGFFEKFGGNAVDQGAGRGLDFDVISKPRRFKAKFVDVITNFDPSADALGVDVASFDLDASATFASGANKISIKKELARKDVDFIYDSKNGGLYFNENGAKKGFGDGGIIAILKGAPGLVVDNLEFI